VATDPISPPRKPRRRRPTSITLDQTLIVDLHLIFSRRLSSVSAVVREFVAEGIARRKRDEAHADVR